MIFNHTLDSVTWPAGLQILTFGERFNQSLDNVTWPAGLRTLTFGQNFNQSLDNVTWPAGLQTLTFGEHFEQSFANVRWPAGLESLTFDTYAADIIFDTWPITECPRALRELVFIDLRLARWTKNTSAFRCGWHVWTFFFPLWTSKLGSSRPPPYSFQRCCVMWI